MINKAVVSFVILVLAVSCGKISNKPDVSETAKIRGIVILPGSQSNAGARVSLTDTKFLSVTGDSGSFLIEEVAEGCYDLRVEREGYRTHEQEVCVQGGEDKDMGTITMEPVQADECGESRPCPAGKVCSEGRCVEEPCEPAEEVCDGKDNDCDGRIDEEIEGCEKIPCASDADCPADETGSVCGWDRTCEACDATCASDADCSGAEICVPYGNGCTACAHETCQDADGDGYWSTWARNPAACPPAWKGWDCDDNDPSVNQAANETCDGKDNDCNGVKDDGEDGGAGSICLEGCLTDADCPAAEPAGSWCHPETERCVECTATCASDPDCPENTLCLSYGNGCTGCFIEYCIDWDEDGFLDSYNCPTKTDCDGSDPQTHPGAEELCDGKDNDCDGVVEECPQPLIDIEVSTMVIDFYELPVGAENTATLTISASAPEQSSLALVVDDVRIEGDTDAFTLGEMPSIPITIFPGTGEYVVINFSPPSAGPFSGRLAIQSNDPDEPVLKVVLRGTGI